MPAPNRNAVYAAAAPLICRDVDALAPGLRDPLNSALEKLEELGIPCHVLETYRPDALQRLYYSIGRDTVTGEIVESPVVTNGRTGAHSWHGYRAATDLAYPPANVDTVVAIMAANGFAWGGKWPHIHDTPHFQSARLPVSPTAEDQADFAAGNIGNVWIRYGIGAS